MRLWLAVSILWIVGVMLMLRPDVQLSHLRAPIEIQFARHQFRFLPGTPATIIAATIDRWIAAENELSRKLREGVPLDAMTDDELIRMAHRVGIPLDRAVPPSEPSLRSALNWESVRRQLAKTTTYTWSLVGDAIAADAVRVRSDTAAEIVARFFAWALLPPVCVVVLGVARRKFRAAASSRWSAQ